uniref:Transmembrane protein n=1 Tax=Fagus sylvatica TaxID=28930 RepID=A0A2N9F8B5_FAGSY
MATHTKNPVDIERVEQKEEDEEEIQKLEKKEKHLDTIIEGQDKRLNDLQSAAFNIANYYFVFQGVILTIVCNGSQTLKPSDRWFLFTLCILAVLLNLFAFFKIGNKYNKTKAEQEDIVSQRNQVYQNIQKLRRDDKPTEKFINHFEQRKRNIYLGLFIIFFLGFAVVVLVGCWKFLGNQIK